MKRDGECELFGLVREATNALKQSTGRNRDVPCANAEPRLRIHATQGFEQCLVVEERLTLTHADDIGDTHVEVL